MVQITLSAPDGHTLSAERILPEGPALGGLVVVQEIFGVNAHIRSVAARFAAAGYAVVAPALFDRVERGVVLGYDEEGFTRGRALVDGLDDAGVLADLEAARLSVAEFGSVAAVGYCFGGSVVWTAAAELAGLAGVVSYYGSRIARAEQLRPKVPVLMHVGAEDASFPIEVVERVVKYPGVVAHIYPAGHGFNCDHRADFHPDSAALALERTFRFLDQIA